MKVQDVRNIRREDNLADAARQTAESGCGVLPVVDAQRKVVGVITDRDICITLGKRDAKPSQLRVEDAMATPVRSCAPDEDLASAVPTMKQTRVRRLPVTDGEGRIRGILSLNDVVTRSQLRGEVLDAMRTICEHTAESRSAAL